MGNNYRIIVISDIHGHLHEFERLIVKLDILEDDYLIILGDFINRGPDNLEVLRKIMDLSKRKNTFILKGNHEAFIMTYFKSEEKFHELYNFFRNDYYKTILNDMAVLLDFDYENNDSFSEFRNIIQSKFKDELSFIDSLPIIFENEHFIFVHGGYDSSICPNSEEEKLLKYDDYNKLGPINEKTVIVGHWPTSNLRDDILSNNPIFNERKNIISIDGGIGVKISGELNGFVIKFDNGYIDYKNVQVNSFIKRKIKEEFSFPIEELYLINYPDFEIEIIEKDDIYSEVKHKKSGKIISVFNSLINEVDGNYLLKTVYINRFFNLKKGDYIEVCESFDNVVLVKYNEEFGWVFKTQIEWEPAIQKSIKKMKLNEKNCN
jgi:protein phosphatase